MTKGRPSKFSPEVREKILQAVSVGAPLELAAQAAGISYMTLRRWLRRGERASKGEYRSFALAVQEAQGRAATKWLALVERAAQDNWAAAAWKLAHLYPQHFGRNRVEVTGKDGQPIEQKLHHETKLITDPETQAAIIEVLAKANALGAIGLPSDIKPPNESESKNA